MAYVGELIGKMVADVEGERIGPVKDLIAAHQAGMPHPRITALLVKNGSGTLAIPMSDVAVLVAPAVPLNRRRAEITPYLPGPTDLYLMRDVIDKQIIDTDGVRVVRVNDLELARVNQHFYLANVDIGTLGMLRRLGLAKAVQGVAGRFGRRLRPGVISWEDVELMPDSHAMRLRVPSSKITELHPADLADIISDLSRSESNCLLESLDIETLAEALEEVEPEFQASLVEGMSDEKVADVLEVMAPDEAADLLAELPDERSEELLNLMEDEEAEGVRRLLVFPEESAGGIMNTEFAAIPPDLTAEQAIAVLRETAHEAETVYYIYVVDGDNHLIGVISLRELVLARPDTPIEEFMHRRVVSVRADVSQDEVARAVAKYNLLALPVVDEEDRLQGIVTADDALDKIIPTAWKKRLPRLYHR